MTRWFGTHGHLLRVGVEGTGSYGAGLARYLMAAGIEVVEVNRPNRQLRRQRGGKTDSVDAEAAARAAASGQATAVPKSGDGPVECIRMLLVARRSATKARTQAANQIHSVAVTAPEPLKRQLRGLKLKARVAVCARWRPGPEQTTTAYAKMALRYLARRYRTLDTEIAELKIEIRRLCAEANPALLAAKGVGPDTAAALLVAAGDNPERMKSERSFAALCGASPVQASSGQTIRHRLNRGGNRQANNALWRIATTRIRTDAATKDYVTRRQGEGKNRKEIIRCLKRHIAREVYRLLTNPPQPRTAPPYAPDANKAASPSPRPPKPSEPTPAASQHSNTAETTTTTSPPDTRTGSEPTNPPHHRLDNHRSIDEPLSLVVVVRISRPWGVDRRSQLRGSMAGAAQARGQHRGSLWLPVESVRSVRVVLYGIARSEDQEGSVHP